MPTACPPARDRSLARPIEAAEELPKLSGRGRPAERIHCGLATDRSYLISTLGIRYELVFDAQVLGVNEKGSPSSNQNLPGKADRSPSSNLR